MSQLHLHGLITITAVEEEWHNLEDQLNACDGVLFALKAFREKYPQSPRFAFAGNAIERYERIRGIAQEQQLRVEEWLIDHEAKGWTSS